MTRIKNTCSVSKILNHLEYCLYLYYEYGNTPTDSTTKEQRKNSVGQDVGGKVGNIYLRSKEANSVTNYLNIKSPLINNSGGKQ
jgi:hypothetical protein